MDQRMKFGQLCETLEKISHAPKEKKFKILNQLLSACRESNTTLVSSFFSLVRILLPELDNERGSYGVQEKKLADTYIRILCLPKNGQDAKKLLKFRSPTAGNTAGDFADMAFWILKSRCRDGGTLTVDDVNCHLDKIASFKASGKPKCVDDELYHVLLKMSAEEQKWFIRLLLKDLRLGIGKVAILNTIHLDANELYNTCNNLRKVSETLREKEKRLHEIEVCLFEPCRPMRSERYDITKVEALFKSSPFYYVEKKHDGERFQIHIEKGSFRYFSRNAVDYTDKLGSSSEVGFLTPLLAKQLHPSVQSCILDGEMMGWSTQDNYFGCKSMCYDVKHMKVGNEYRPCFCVFDILLLNGEVLTNKPFQERIKYLAKAYTPLDGVIMSTPQHCLTTSLEVMKALNDAIDLQEEGLILKHPTSIYKPAAKNGSGWYKIKPEYTVGLTDELDLIIIGGLFGSGRKSNIISHFLLGVAVAPEGKGTPPSEFHSVCRVGSGYSNKELAELLEKLSPHWKPVMGTSMPHGVVWTKERPHLWIEPCNSQLLQVKASEINPSNHYKAGFTLRFPRVVKIRYDKSWIECCDTNELNKLRLSNCGKLAIRHVDSADLTQVSLNKRQRVKAIPAVGEDYRAADLSNIVAKGSLLSGREICVFSGNSQISKQDLEKRIHEQGGTVVQNRGPDTFCVVAGKMDFRLRNLSDKGDIDVVTVKWFLHVLNNERLTEWEPEDLLIMSSKTHGLMKMKYDSFFDSYNKPTTEEKLKKSLEKVSEQGLAVNLLPIEMGDIDVELFSDCNEFAIFRCCTAFFLPPKEEERFLCSLFKAMFIFQGGRVSESESSDVTHVVIGANQQEELEYCQQRNHSRFKKFHIVTYDWIESCWSHQCHLHERDYHPNSLFVSSK